jgi:dienelactone hydrolase
MSDRTPTRRHFLAAAGMASLEAALVPDSAPTSVGEPGRPGPPPDTPRELKPTGSDLGSLFPEVEKLAAANRYSFALSGGRFRTFEEFRAAAREKVLELLLYRPEKVDPRPEVLERIDRGDHIRERILFSTSPHFRVPAYVLVPKKRQGPAPAVVDLHSHGGMFLFGKEKVVDLGDNHPAMTAYHERNYDGRPTATALVRRGYVVITIDALLFGERRILLDADLARGWDRSKYSLEDVAHLNQQCRGKEATVVKGLVLAGATWPGIVFWDDMRTVDYLATRPEVDPRRIGCLGISMGGYRSLYLAALDDRIAAACVTGFMSSVRPMIRAHLDTHSWVHFLPGLHRFLDLPDVASLAAPRALLVQQCARDQLFPPAGMKESVEVIAAAFEKAGARARFSGRFYDVPHQFTRAMQDEAFAWLDQHLAHKAP